MNAFEVLGIPPNADQAQIRSAYRSGVKECHPDRFQEKEQQDRAQERLIRLNLAYEEAMRLASKPVVTCRPLSPEEAKQAARRMLDLDRPESALCQLVRTRDRDAEWYFIQGEILLRQHQYSDAHRSYREAVSMDPDNLQYRRGAFLAAKALQKHARPLQKAVDAVTWVFRSGRREK